LIATTLLAVATLATGYCVLEVNHQVRRFTDWDNMIDCCCWLLAVKA